MKKISMLFVMTSIAAASFATAHAGNRANAITLTPAVGYYGFADSRELNNTAAIPSVSLAYNIDSKWGLEATYAQVNTSFYHASGGVTGRLYLVDTLYRFYPHHMFEPYVSGGLGVLYLNPNANNNPANQANINLGLGTQMFFDESIALRAEVRDLYTMSHGRNDVMASLGVSFLIGGDTHVKPVSYKGEAFTDE